jgi:biotin carboxylase
MFVEKRSIGVSKTKGEVMEKLIILGAGYFQKDLVRKAKELGYETHVFGKGKHRLQTVAGELADYYYPISVLSPHEILEEARKIQPAGITSMGADIAVPTMNFVAQELGLVGNSPECGLVATNKHEMKKRFREHGIPTADFVFVGADCYEATYPPFPLPVMVKAIDKAGKLGITKVDSIHQLKPAIDYGIKESETSDKVLIEEFVEGKEYSIEGISWRGNHMIIALTEKFNIPPHFVEEMHLQPAIFDLKCSKCKISKIFSAALDALGIKNGASHTEFKITPEGDIKIIEIGARMAAESMWEVVQISTGLDYMRMIIDIATNKALNWAKIQTPSPVGLVKFVITENDFDNLERIKREHPDKIHRIDEIAPYNPDGKITHNLDRYGYYLLKCSSREEALAMTKLG